MTIIERFGDRGRTATVSWAYARSYQKPIRAPQNLALLPRFGMNVRLVHPPQFGLMPEIFEEATENARRAHAGFEILHDFDEGFRGSDVIYAKSWGALLTTTDEAGGSRLIRRCASWITDEQRMSTAGENAIFMHPPPADRNAEVTDGVLDGPQSAGYDQAETACTARTPSWRSP